MKVIVISNPTVIQNEANLINDLFNEGLSCFHLRKPNASEAEI
jgi:thiamine-phosphate pyrophosphorylase